MSFAVHLLRHGAPAAPGRLLGHRDEPALRPDDPTLLARVAGLPVARVITSDLSRTAETARIVAAMEGHPLERDPRWRELDFGAWDGLAPQAIPADALARFHQDPDQAPPPGGERWSALVHRVGAALADLREPVLVVTHAGAMRAALAALTGLDHRGVWALDLPYGALLSLQVWPGMPPAGQVTGLVSGQVP